MWFYGAFHCSASPGAATTGAAAPPAHTAAAAPINVSE